MMEVIVEYDYTAKEPDELTIKKGDIIKDVVKKQGGWWEGYLKDKRGMFPDNFVRPLDKDSSVILRSKKDVSRIRQCRVVFSYNQEHEDELNLNVGDVIDIVGEVEEGWWRGTLNGKEGVFPSNFVEEIVSQPKPSIREDSSLLAGEVEAKAPKLPAKPTKQLCEVRYAYKAQNEDELTMKEGDIITLISRDSLDPGWWKGELNGRIGVFPDNFVMIIPNFDDKTNSKDDKKSKIINETGALKPSSIASQRKSLEIKSDKLTSAVSPPGVDTPIHKTPPAPSKKPTIAVKKSPSAGHVTTGSSGGIFSEIKKKIVDAVDGATGSKSVKHEDTQPEAQQTESNSDNAFDHVERRPLLPDVRATRVKAPGRRLPSSLHKEDASVTGEVTSPQPTAALANGTTEHIISDTSSTEQSSTEMTDGGDKPRLREWEKHRAPWLEEMKLSQAKRTSTSPGRDNSLPRLRLTPTGTSTAADEPDAAKALPIEKEEEMSKSMPSLDLSKSLSPVVPSKSKTPPDELDRSPVVRTKPAIITSRQSLANVPKEVPVTNRHTVQVPMGPREFHPKPTAPSPPKISPVTAQKPEKERPSPEIQNEFVTHKQYMELITRLAKLELLVERQNVAIEDLKNKLQLETEMRMMLQEKTQNVQV